MRDDDRLRPDGIEQFQRCRVGRRRQCLFDRRPRQLQIRHAREDSLCNATIHPDPVICKKELCPGECRAIALLAQIGRVAMQQGVQDGCRRR
jgi:hypothetical protein